jgi:hypothetical protein
MQLHFQMRITRIKRTTTYTVAKPVRQFGHAMQILDHHHSFL